MTIRKSTCLAFLATFLLPLAAMAKEQSKLPGKPNIVFILADDLGGIDLGCYGSRHYETPNLDRMAARGMRFTDGYAASSVCSPTRYSIQTGKYPARGDLTLWLNGSSGKRRRLLDAPAVKQMASEEITIAESLRKAGYATASIGKWHLGGEPYYPEHQGYGLNYGGWHSGSPAGGYFLPNKMPMNEMPKEGYLTDHLTDRALKYIEEKQGEPFFIYQSYHSVHTPIQGKPELVKYYKEKFARLDVNAKPTYAAMLHSLDENVGRILDKLDELKLTERTAVFFFSDNGGYLGATNNMPLRKGKGYSYEGGHREPMLVQYPAMIKPGTICSEPLTSTDFYPTILELAGLPLLPEQHVDGVSFASLLKNPSESLGRDAIYWHYPHYSPQGGTPSGAIREGDMKLIEFFEDGRLELYNLKDDLSEATDLSADNPELSKKLHEKLQAWRDEVDAKMPIVNPNFNQKPPPRRRPQAKPTPVDYTEELPSTWPGPRFGTLHNVRIDRSELGTKISSDVEAWAVRKLDEPLRRATLKATVRPRAGMPSNGALLFGDLASSDGLIRCSLMLGGGKAVIYEKAYPSEDGVAAPLTLRDDRTYQVTIDVDLDASTVVMRIGRTTVTKKLSRKLEWIRYVGPGIIWTEAEFSPITISQP